jgi:hypothetical protein
VPAATFIVVPEVLWRLFDVLAHQHTHTFLFWHSPTDIFLPDDAEEKWARRVHDGNIWDEPVAVIYWERLDYAQEEGVSGDGAHDIVTDAGWIGCPNEGWEVEEGVEGFITALGSQFKCTQRGNEQTLSKSRYTPP